MDYKPRRSESEAPHGTYTAGQATQTTTNLDGTTRPAGHTVSATSPHCLTSDAFSSDGASYILVRQHVTRVLLEAKQLL